MSLSLGHADQVGKSSVRSGSVVAGVMNLLKFCTVLACVVFSGVCGYKFTTG